MRPGGKVVLGVLSAIFRPSFWRKVRENRRAVRAGLPKPTPPGELLIEALEMGAGGVLPAVKNDRVREGIERGMEMLQESAPGDTPTERPSAKHRGVR